MTKRAIIAIVYINLIIIIHGCGSGGGNTNMISTPSQVIAFSGNTPGNQAVYMSQNSSLSSGNTLAIDIKANNVSNAYGFAFDLDFDPTKMTYDSYAAGNYLEGGGNIPTYLVTAQAGKLIVGLSRLGTVGGVSGSGTIITLKFKAVAAGNASVNSSNNTVRDSGNQSIPGVTWNGGTATIIF